jgi:hypothetical protein
MKVSYTHVCSASALITMFGFAAVQKVSSRFRACPGMFAAAQAAQKIAGDAVLRDARFAAA